jgi:hypothetical protein
MWASSEMMHLCGVTPRRCKAGTAVRSSLHARDLMSPGRAYRRGTQVGGNSGTGEARETVRALLNLCFAAAINISGIVLDVFLLSLFARHLQGTLPVRRRPSVHSRLGGNSASF